MTPVRLRLGRTKKGAAPATASGGRRAAAVDPLIHQPARLAILAALNRNRELTFRDLRDGLGLTAGNLGSHVAKLEEAGYVATRHVIANLSVEMRYRMTDAGDAAFRCYVAELRALLVELAPEEPPATPPSERPMGVATPSVAHTFLAERRVPGPGS